MKSVNPMMVVAVLLWVVCGAAWAGGSIEFSGGGGGFSGGTVSNAVVLTGDNSGGTGTLIIRPGDNDSQLVLAESSSLAASEMKTTLSHDNFTTTQSVASTIVNGYIDTGAVVQRHWTSAGYTRQYMSAGSTANQNYWGMVVAGTGGAIAGDLILQASGAATTNFVVGTNGTVTTDIRGPILNGGSATCNGLIAGSVCFNDIAKVQYAANAAGVVSDWVQNTSADGAATFAVITSAGGNGLTMGYANASFSDADYASKGYVLTGTTQMFGRTDDVAAGTVGWEWRDNTSASGVQLMTLDGAGNLFLNASATRTKGTITLAAGTGTATVSSGCVPACSDTTAVNAVQCSVSGTTLTANGTGTDVISYVCL